MVIDTCGLLLFFGESIHGKTPLIIQVDSRNSKRPELWHMNKSISFGLQILSTDLRDRKMCLSISIALLWALRLRHVWQLLGLQYSWLSTVNWEKPCWRVKLSLLKCFLHQHWYGICEGAFWVLSCKNCPIFSSCYLKILLVFTVLHICLQWTFVQKFRPPLISYKHYQCKCCFLYFM